MRKGLLRKVEIKKRGGDSRRNLEELIRNCITISKANLLKWLFCFVLCAVYYIYLLHLSYFSFLLSFVVFAVFKYNKDQHNVVVVDENGYKTCTASGKEFSSGNDEIKLARGQYYFICGVPGHCDRGQKIAVTAN